MTKNITKADKVECQHLKNDDPDAELVALVQSQLPYQTSAYVELMKRHQKLLSSVCFRLLNNPTDVDDVVQEVMLKVFGAIKSFESRACFKTWLVRIAMNTCSNMRDKLKRMQEMKDSLSNNNLQTPKNTIPTDLLDAHKILSKLEPIERELLTLRFIADLKLEEISEMTGLSLSATKMRIYRATEQLKSSTQKQASQT